MPSFLRKVALLSFVVLCGMLLSAQSKPRFECTPVFPYQAPWMGADVGYSVPLSDGRDFWIFGDTLYGDKREVTGDDPRMVRNTVGISTCKGGKWNIDYTIRRGGDGKFLDFFQARQKDTWYWALSGAEHNNELWIANLCVKTSPKTSSAALGFEICGTDLAHVTGLTKDPQDWKIANYPFTNDAQHIEAGSAALVQDDRLYLFSLWENGGRPTILLRIPASATDDPRSHAEYFGGDERWHSGIDPEKAKPIMQHGASEMSVNYHPDLKKWIAVLVDPDIFSAKVLLRSAPAMTGPWTDGEVVYRIPELQKDGPHYDADTFCYAGKEHPEFEKAGELVFSYLCNTMKPKKLETETNIYTPQIVRMPMPAWVTGK